MDDPVARIMLALRDVTAAMQERMRTLLGEGIGMPHMLALRRIVLGGPTTLSRLAEANGITKGAMSPIVQRLVDEGLAERQQDAHDRRVHWIAPTDKALATKQAIEQGMRALLLDMTRDWDAAHTRRFADDLEHLRGRLEATPGRTDATINPPADG